MYLTFSVYGKGCDRRAEAPSAYLHLPAGHEVCTLTDALEDLLQLRVNERIIWKNEERFRTRLRFPLTGTAPGHILPSPLTLDAEHLSYFQRRSADFTQRVDYSLCVGLRQERRVEQSAHVWRTAGTEKCGQQWHKQADL